MNLKTDTQGGFYVKFLCLNSPNRFIFLFHIYRKEIIRQLKRKNKEIPFVVVSQYSKFSENNETLSLEEIAEQLNNISQEFYIDTVLYDTSSSNWKILLENILTREKIK